MQFLPLTEAHDAALARIIRQSLESVGLDIPGTAYYDASLDRLSAYYSAPGRAYFVLTDGEEVLGGVGLAECELFPDCCELQKLYLCDAAKGHRLGYALMERIEREALRLGYRAAYLETHSLLTAALHLYARCGYREIPRPASIVHSAMDRFCYKQLV